jgi:hypothetical protein
METTALACLTDAQLIDAVQSLAVRERATTAELIATTRPTSLGPDQVERSTRNPRGACYDRLDQLFL